jgi:transcriptional regulator with XRE-family HTH domain
VTGLRECRQQLDLTQAEMAARLGVALNSLRMWDSGLRPTPDAVLERPKFAAAEAMRDREPLTLPHLATALGIHMRTLQAAARTGRLEVTYDTRSVFGRPLRLSTRSAGRAFMQRHYARYSGQPAGSFEVPQAVPRDCAKRLRKCRLQHKLSQADLGKLLGQPTKQWFTSGSPGSAFPHRSSGRASRHSLASATLA